MIYGSSAITYFPSASYSSDRIALPVAPSQFIYSQFKHVSGIPAPEGTQGVTVTKLKILDVLIDQLAQMKKQPELNIGASGPMTDEHIDALIGQYETEIRGARAASAAMPYKPAPPAPSGVLFNLVA